MLEWLSNNWGNIVVIGVIVLAVAAVVFFHVRAKRAGKSTCSCGCSDCAMKGICHQSSGETEKK